MEDVSDVVGGGTPSTKKPEYFAGGTIEWITPADLSGYTAKYIGSGSRSITDAGLRGSGARLLPEGTVLFTSRAPIGYVAIASNAISTNQGFKSFVLGPGLDSEYVYYYLKRSTELAVQLSSGTTFREISGAKAKQIPIAVSPVPEQRRIVDALDSYLSRLDAAEAALKRVQANLKRYRASVLKAAVEGRLVPTEAELAREQGREYEPAEVLLERILVERRARWEEAELARLEASGKAPKDDRWKQKYKEPVVPDLDGLPELPEGWCWASADALSEATRSITYGVIKLGSETPDGVPVLRSSNVRHLHLDLQYVKPIEKALSEQYERTILRGGEVLVTVRGTLGGVAVVPEECATYNVSREVAVISLVSAAVGPAVAVMIGSSQLQMWLDRRTRGITYQGINIQTLKELPVPVPPLDEQTRLVEAVQRQHSIGAEIAAAVEREFVRLARLRQSTLAAAFAGNLVDQDSSDEPASELLIRISAERERRGSEAKAANHVRSKRKATA